MNRVLIVSAAILLGVIVWIFARRKVHYVDPKPAVAYTGEYFSKLKRGEVQDACAMYSDSFRRNAGTTWQKFLTDLSAQAGAVTEFILLDTKIVPKATPAGEVPCIAVRYHVARSVVPTEETLVVCPSKSNAQLAIEGHELVRLDTQQRVTAGTTVEERDLFRIGTKASAETHSDFEVAQKAADQFYRRVSAGEYGAVWDAADDDLKHSASRDQLVSLMREVNQKLGTCGTPTLVGTDYATRDSQHFVGLIYRRNCEHGQANERLAWKIVDGTALLRGYH